MTRVTASKKRRVIGSLIRARTAAVAGTGSVGLPGPEDDDIDHLAALAIVQGCTNYGAVHLGYVESVKATMVARGLLPIQYDKWEVSRSAIAAARRIVTTLSLPEDLTMVHLDV